MTTNNDAMTALESMPRPEYNDDRLGDWASENYETIRTALKKSAQVDGLIEIVTAIRDTATGDSVTISAIKEAAREQLKQFSAMEI